jgi:hypothetical protein
MQLRTLLRFSCLAVCFALSNLSSLAQTAPTAPQQAQVTFYSGGSLLKSQIPGDKHGTFVGRIMDGHQQLAMLMPDRFVTFNLDPGEHTLAANGWVRGDPVGRGHLKINLAPGQHYYLQAYMESLVVATLWRVEQRTCQEAQDDNKITEPLKQEHIKDYGLTRVVTESSFPTCPQNTPITPGSQQLLKKPMALSLG